MNGKRTPEQMDVLRKRILLDLPDLDAIEIRDCPLCGSKSGLQEMLRRYYARCTRCGCSGPLRATPEQAKQAWDERYE